VLCDNVQPNAHVSKYLCVFTVCKNPKSMVQHGTSSHSPTGNAEAALPEQYARTLRTWATLQEVPASQNLLRSMSCMCFRRSRDRSQSRLRPVSRVSTWNLHRASVKRRMPCACKYVYVRMLKNLYFRLQEFQDHAQTLYLLSQSCRERS
jgi:hypothetical protein